MTEINKITQGERARTSNDHFSVARKKMKKKDKYKDDRWSYFRAKSVSSSASSSAPSLFCAPNRGSSIAVRLSIKVYFFGWFFVRRLNRRKTTNNPNKSPFDSTYSAALMPAYIRINPVIPLRTIAPRITVPRSILANALCSASSFVVDGRGEMVDACVPV